MSYGLRKIFGKTLAFFIAMTLIISAMSIDSFALGESEQPAFSGGEGTAASPYLISNRADLIAFADSMNSGGTLRDSYFRLTADIDLAETEWNPVGNVGTSFFSGIFDGNGKRITIRKIKAGKYIGLFGMANFGSTIKNLTIFSTVNITYSSSEEIYFGLVAAMAEGIVYNCKTEGSVTLTLNSPKELFVGGIIGSGSGSFSYLQNSAALSLTRTGKAYTYIGGIAGRNNTNKAPFSYITNTGKIYASIDGEISSGGIIGEYSSGAKMYSLLNSGDVTVAGEKTNEGARIDAGGIVGVVMNADLEKALNRGKVNIVYSGGATGVETAAGGIAGKAIQGVLRNVGNEGNVEVKGPNYIFSSGITGICGREAKIENAYNKGSIYGSSTYSKAELYVAGLLDGEAVVDNFYNSGTARLKAIGMSEINGYAIANIRPDYNTKTLNYCYWPSGLSPFPLLVPAQPNSASFNTSTGKLSKTVSIGGKGQSTLTAALNAWVSGRQGDYLNWSDAAVPSFNFSFGYKLLAEMAYKNSREGKWINASDWAYEWLDKADKLDIIPGVLINADMIKPITRLEFCALAVELYEILSGKAAEGDTISPFTDTSDQSVIKAYKLGIVTGMGKGIFAPNNVLTREQAAVMLTRAYKAAYWEGWTLAEDETYSAHSLDIEGVAMFSDDALIGSWAKPSVYFMVKSGIINGIGGNLFAPGYKAGERQGYGTATREQAFKIAVAMKETFSVAR